MLIAGATTANAQTTIITCEPVQTQIQTRTVVTTEHPLQLTPVPETVAVEVPAIKSYKSMVVNDRVVLVDPATSEVVAELVN